MSVIPRPQYVFGTMSPYPTHKNVMAVNHMAFSKFACSSSWNLQIPIYIIFFCFSCVYVCRSVRVRRVGLCKWEYLFLFLCFRAVNFYLFILLVVFRRRQTKAYVWCRFYRYKRERARFIVKHSRFGYICVGMYVWMYIYFFGQFFFKF